MLSMRASTAASTFRVRSPVLSTVMGPVGPPSASTTFLRCRPTTSATAAPARSEPVSVGVFQSTVREPSSCEVLDTYTRTDPRATPSISKSPDLQVPDFVQMAIDTSVGELLPQSCLAKLASSRAGDFGEELEPIRHLPFRELGREVLSEFVGCDGVPIS